MGPRSHILVHGAVPGQLRLIGGHFQVYVVHGEGDDDDQPQDDSQDQR